MGGKFGAVALSAVFTNDTGGFTAATGFSNAGLTLKANTSVAATWSTVVSSNVAASMTVTADKTAYETGSIVSLTFKGLDVNGLILPDACSYDITSTSDIAVAGVNASNVVGLASTNLGTSVKFGGLGSACVGDTTVSPAGGVWPYASATPGESVVKFYAPVVVGPFNITVKRGATNYSATIGSTSTVLALASQNAAAMAQAAAMEALRAELKAAIEAAADAAAEAIDAGNNAYDSANAATDAADAATAAAQQAGEDAVAAADASTAAAQSAQDAANEATDAATAATDAANAAAEAADAATAAAQDAADAVAALSVAVSAMVSDLKKQITALTNLVIKIQKKVKA
jgi:hypothetical protein